MVEEFHIIQIKDSPLRGGTTKPFVVLAENHTGTQSFVLKYFNPQNYGTQNPTFIEFLVAFLAGEFDLSVPQVVLLYLEKEIADHFSRSYVFEYSCNGYLFGSKLIEGSVTETKGNQIHLPSFDLESIFAFDVMIRNLDRRTDKPNILELNGQYYLIDHEQCLHIDREFTDMILNPSLWKFIQPGVKGPYLFMKKLIHLKKRHGTLTFDTFIENLRNLNWKRIDEYVSYLEYKGIRQDNWNEIRQYLVDVQQNITNFVSLLNQLIR